MPRTTNAVDGTAIKKAMEERNGKLLASFYTDDALLRVIDRWGNPPSKPREIRGKAAIATFWGDICGRMMAQRGGSTIAEGDQIAFTEACTYADGAKVFCAAVVELREGRSPGRRSCRYGMDSGAHCEQVLKAQEMAAGRPAV